MTATCKKQKIQETPKSKYLTNKMEEGYRLKFILLEIKIIILKIRIFQIHIIYYSIEKRYYFNSRLMRRVFEFKHK